MNQPTSRTKLYVPGFLTSLALLLLAPTAFAQDPAPAAPTETPAPAPAPETPAPPADAPAPAPAAEAAPASTTGLEDRLGQLEGQLEGMAEPFSAMQSDVSSLKKVKLSGYVQGRYEWHDDANFGLEGSKRRETNRFFVRRGRVKTTYAGNMSEFVLQIDATGDGVTLKDAEASFVLTNENTFIPSSTPWELKLTMGQFKIPFGFEVLQSSSEREMPERAKVIGLFPGERDRGVRLQYTYDWFKVMAAVINGNFTNDADHGSFDQTSWKDVVGKVSGDFDFLVVGVSGHAGRFLKTVRPPSTAMPVAGYERYSRLRLGADAQAYVDVPGLGGLSLRGEMIWSRDKQMDFAEVKADPTGCKDADAFGWIGTAVQHIGDHLGVVVRVDQYDPTASLKDSCMTKKTTDAAGVDKVTNVGFGLLGYISANLKATLVYEHLGEHEGVTKDNDILTLQMQAKF
jgi:hypothetical protein